MEEMSLESRVVDRHDRPHVLGKGLVRVIGPQIHRGERRVPVVAMQDAGCPGDPVEDLQAARQKNAYRWRLSA
jgi:hypothetical protein